MKLFDENIDYNFDYSNVWASRIEENFGVDKFLSYTERILNIITSLEVTDI